MREILIFGALLFLGCADKSDDASGEETGGTGGDSGDDSGDDTGDDSIDDTGGDSGDDTGGTGGDSSEDSGDGDDTGDDTGGDSGDDTGDAGCTARDLVASAEVRDSAGTAGTIFATTTSLFFAGVLQNPCDAEISFDTVTACLVDSWQVVGSSGIGIGMGEVCAAVVTTWTIPAGDSIEYSIEWGKLTLDTWELTVDFAGAMPAVTTTFDVY